MENAPSRLFNPQSPFAHFFEGDKSILSNGVAYGVALVAEGLGLHDADDSLDGMIDVDESQLERGESEATDVRCPKVADDASLDQRLDDAVALGVTKRHLTAPFRMVAWRDDIEDAR